MWFSGSILSTGVILEDVLPVCAKLEPDVGRTVLAVARIFRDSSSI